jgi:SulP family sulfate permease
MLFESLADRLRDSGRTLLICGARDQPASLIERSKLYENVGKDGLLQHIEAALAGEGFDGAAGEYADTTY